MDFSQLPKMSDSAKAAKDEAAQRAAANNPATPASPLDTPRQADRRPIHRDDIAYGPGGFGFGGVWISLIGGFICLLFGINFAKWAAAKMTGKAFETGVFWQLGDKAGQPVTYFELQGGTAWTETGLFLMGVALLFDASLMFAAFRGRTPNRAVVATAVLITGAAVVLNAVLTVYLLTIGITPLTSLVALLVGGMVLFDHVPMLKARRG